VPKSGYINAMDYSSPQHLAEYLIFLSNNKTAYNSYFQWKKHVNFFDYDKMFSPVCDVCIKLHLEHYFGVESKVLENIESYTDWKNCKQKIG
jgi:hypothetical protein